MHLVKVGSDPFPYNPQRVVRSEVETPGDQRAEGLRDVAPVDTGGRYFISAGQVGIGDAGTAVGAQGPEGYGRRGPNTANGTPPKPSCNEHRF